MSDAPATSEPPAKKRSDVAIRLATALPLVPVLLWLMFAGPRWAFHVLVGGAVAIGASELMVMTIPDSRTLRVLGVLGALGVWAAVALTDDPRWLHPTLIALGVFALVGGLVRPEPVETAAFRSAWLFAGPIYVGGLLGCVDLLHGLPRGGAWVLLSMFLSWTSDTFAYFTGRAFGRTKLYEKLSPKKTVEGSLGGLGGGILGAVASTFWLPIPLLDAILLAVVANLIGQAGDLFESLLKRSVGVKDSGRLLPGHGGMLDRVDALMYTAAVTWLYASVILPLR